jgi:hypothetical protein
MSSEGNSEGWHVRRQCSTVVEHYVSARENEKKKIIHNIINIKKKVEACPKVGKWATLGRQMRKKIIVTHF